MINLLRTNSKNADFITLVKQLDEYLKIVDGDDHAFYNQYNSIEELDHVVVAFDDYMPLGCGAFKPYENSAEIKRMFVIPSNRGKGIASKILKELETWAFENQYANCILETGQKQKEAISLYEKNGYIPIPNFGPYKNIENSRCFQKTF